MPYNEMALGGTAPWALKMLSALSIPFGEREFGRPLRLLKQPLSLARRLGFGARYRTPPESPYLDKPHFYNVPVQLVSMRSVADGQGCHVRLRKPPGWDDVRWEAGTFASLRVEVDGAALVRQYKLGPRQRPDGDLR